MQLHSHLPLTSWWFRPTTILCPSSSALSCFGVDDPPRQTAPDEPPDSCDLRRCARRAVRRCALPVFPRKLDIRRRRHRRPHAARPARRRLRQQRPYEAGAGRPRRRRDAVSRVRPERPAQQDQQYTSVISQIDNIRRQQLDPCARRTSCNNSPCRPTVVPKLTTEALRPCSR